MRQVPRCIRLAVVAVALGAIAPATAQAVTFPVTKQADTLDGNCDASDCSLREAIVAANGNGGTDDITVPAGNYLLTIGGAGENSGATGDLDITGDVTITGAGAGVTTVDAGGDSGILDRVFDVRLSANATMSGMTITGGRAPTSANGGGVNSDSGGTVTLTSLVVSDNHSGAGGQGGGVVSNGATGLVVIRDSVVTNNRSSNGGGVSENGGAVGANGTVGIVIERSSITGNTATDPGGGQGGGVIEDGGGEVAIRDSTISGNRAESGTGPGFGGGFAANGGGNSQLSNVTISGNTASGMEAFGGGVAENGGGTISLTNATITGNTVDGAGITPQHAGGSITESGGSSATVTLKNSIVNAGTPTNCVATSGTIPSAGNNIDSGTSCAFGAGGDQSGADPLLGPLADNGGPTQTHRLLNGSPALDTADNAACPAADQRGVSRPQPAGGICDKGALERVAADVAVAVSAPATVRPGQQISYAVTATNRGPGTATGVVVTDALPAGLTQAAASSPTGACTVDPQVSCNLGALASGASTTITITATATTTGTVSNTVNIAQAATAEDPDPANNSATAQTTVAGAVLVPERGETVVAAPVSGRVFVATPTAAASGVAGRRPASGFTHFRRLRAAELIPVSSFLDTRKGVVRLRSAVTRDGSRTQAGRFSRGQFQVGQPASAALTTLRMVGGGNFKKGCAPRKSANAAGRRRPRRSLFGNARGRFRTRGRNSHATVRGTKWLTKDTCAGTLTVVRQGSVRVRDLRKRRTVTVRAGRRYLARARRR
jgi:uncharacterized repeat protein (TIGR01451 family)/CSLREA domain-containing protein